MEEYRHSSHTVSHLSAHIVWVTKYRYHVLKGDVQVRCRDLVVQICNAENVQILKGVVSKDHVHVHIEYPPSLSVRDLVKKLKGRTSRLLQQEFPLLGKQYWGRHFWAGLWGLEYRKYIRMKWFRNILNIIEINRMLKLVTGY